MTIPSGTKEELRGTTTSDSNSRRQVPRTSNDAGYDIPDDYANVDEEADPSPIQNPDENPVSRVRSLEERGDYNTLERKLFRRKSTSRPQPSRHSSYNIPDNYANLDELATPSPVENPNESSIYRHQSLEKARNQEQDYERSQTIERRESIVRGDPEVEKKEEQECQPVPNMFTTNVPNGKLAIFPLRYNEA